MMKKPIPARMSDHQIQALAWFVNKLRPDFGMPGIVSALELASDRSGVTPAEVAIAMIRVADNPFSRGPIVVTMDGPHWNRHLSGPEAPRALTPSPGNDTSPDCENHPGVKAWACKTCTRPAAPPPNFRDLVAQETERARAERGWVGVQAG